jgi:hypothetical protein
LHEATIIFITGLGGVFLGMGFLYLVMKALAVVADHLSKPGGES